MKREKERNEIKKKRCRGSGGKWYDRATPIKFDAKILKIA